MEAESHDARIFACSSPGTAGFKGHEHFPHSFWFEERCLWASESPWRAIPGFPEQRSFASITGTQSFLSDMSFIFTCECTERKRADGKQRTSEQESIRTLSYPVRISKISNGPSIK